MLDFVRPKSVGGEDIDILSVCNDAAELMSVGYGRRGYDVEVRAASSLPHVRGDADALKQCLVNLVKNSIEAMPESGTIVLELELDGGDVVLKVVDSGVGNE